jgi:fatty-acid desaturase
MFTLNPSNVILFVLTSVAWVAGVNELAVTLKHINTEWYWYVLATFYTVTINELFGHLICSHYLFKINTKSLTYKILTFLITVDHANGPLTNICINHGNHHSQTDQSGRDNLYFPLHWYTVCSLSPIMFLYQTLTDYSNRDTYVTRQSIIHKDILEDNWTFFCEEFKIPLTLLYWLVLWLVMPVVLFKIVFMGRIIISIITFLTTSLGHSKLLGYRNEDVPNNSNNRLITHYLLGCGLFSSLLHNNHHTHRWIQQQSHSYRWFEIDLGGYIIKLLKLGMAK